MILYCIPYAPIPNETHMLALMPRARRLRHAALHPGVGPLFAYALLSFALEQAYSLCPDELVYTDRGKPYLPGYPIHFSLSHSKSHALCALADVPLGCDVELHRSVPTNIQRRVLGAGESPEDFFAYWTLKESLFKLSKEFDQPFPTLTFMLTGNQATGQGAHGWLYRDIPNCTAAVVAEHPFARPPLELLAPETLFAYTAEKQKAPRSKKGERTNDVDLY